MDGELQIRLVFEGSGSGLERDRLGLEAFSKAFIELQKAFRRIAQGFINAADGGDADAETSGRLSAVVKAFALEIDKISHSSPPFVDLACALPSIGAGNSVARTAFLVDVLDRTADELLTAIESEAEGRHRNGYVRRYLAALPDGVQRQTLALRKFDGTSRSVAVGAYKQTELEVDYPYFAIQSAQVAGVSFAPAPLEIRFSGPDGSFHASADERQVEKALDHRSETMTGLFVKKGNKTTSLWLAAGSSIPAKPSRDVRTTFLMKRWDATLRLLAK